MDNHTPAGDDINFDDIDSFCVDEEDQTFLDQFQVYAVGYFPAYMVQVLAHAPPSSEIVIDFTCICIYAAGTTRQAVLDLMERSWDQPWSYALSQYIRNHFTLNNNKLNFKQISLIGNLLLTVEGENKLAERFRSKMRAPSIFECNIAASSLSPIQKQIMTETVSRTTLDNARCAGVLIKYILLRASQNKPIPDLTFFKDTSESLTAEQCASLEMPKDLMDKCKISD